MPAAPPALPPHDITGLVLAGGQGSRMGGVDKGLQPFHGQPLAAHALRRLAPQVGTLMINANRHLAAYAALGVPVWPDELPGYAGPLAGFLAGLAHCHTPWLLTVPCDTPLLPADLAARLGAAVLAQEAEIAIACAPEPPPPGQPAQTTGSPRPQPVFCLMRSTLQASLTRFVHEGGRKVGAWMALHRCVQVPFDQPGDAPEAFFNANTPDELAALQALASGAP